MAVLVAFFGAGPVVDWVCRGNDVVACQGSGGQFALLVLLRAAVGIPLVLLWRRSISGWDPGNPLSARFLLGWAVLATLVQVVLPIDEFSARVSLETRPVWLLWFAMLIAAPWFEELLFRGALLDLLAGRSKALAACATSAAWVLVHGQYDAVGAFVLFALGLFLAALRFRSGGIAAPIAAHMMWNGAVLLIFRVAS